MPLVYRLTKGSPLTYAELDGNFQFLTGSINSISGAYATTGSNTFIGNQTIQGNLNVFGTASFTYTTSSITTISASTFAVSISSPTIRYGFYEVLDSGASTSTSSLAWDSTNKYWVYRNVTGSVTSSAVLLTGPVGTGGLGTEVKLSQYRIPVSNGNQSLSDSLIYSSGSSTTISGSVFTTTNVIVGGTTSSNVPGFGRILAISGSYPGIVLDNSAVGKTYSIGNGAFSQFFISDDTLNATRFVIESNGSIGLGKSPTTFLDVSGSTFISGALSVTQGITGSLLGTSSYAIQALNASTASLATTASFALTASFAANIPTTASYALQALNASTASLATTASYALNAVSASIASIASTASFLRPLSQSVIITGSVALTGSLNTRNTAAITTFATIGRSGSLYIDLNGVGSNYIDGNILFIRNSTGTTNSVIISGSTTTINTNTTTISGSLNVISPATFNSFVTATGSLGIRKAQGGILLLATSSISSSVSSSDEPTTASFSGSGFLNTNVGSSQWNSSFDLYYSGVSGGGETELSPIFTASFDNNNYNDFSFGFLPRPQITLSPGGSITSYKLYVYNYGDSQWYVKSAIDDIDLQNGITVTLSGPTTSNFGTDLINTAGFSNTSDPTGNVNTITYVSSSTSTVTSSLVNIDAPTIITGSLSVSGSTLFVGTHTLSGSNTITGNTVMSGSIIVSGSTTFRNTTFTVTGSQFYTGSSVYVGNQTITGSLRLQSNGTGTGLFINGQKQFNYISVFHTASILPTQNVSGSFIYSTVATSSGASIVSGSRITFENTGIYNIQFSAQLFTSTGATVDIWFKKNGVNIANSGTKIGPTSNNTYHVPAWNFVESVTSGSYIEIAYQTDQTNTQFQYLAASGNIPAIPSIIATVTQIA
jgi:hypothetical protein